MPRAPRVVYAGAVYHLMCRGDRREAIFRDDQDRQRFLETLEEVCERTGWTIHAYVLMGNHYHLLAETPEPNLVEGMKWFQGTYTQRFNRRHRLCGHLFQGRYKALVVQGKGSEYFRSVADYIHLNPTRAALVERERPDIRSYSWSSAPYFARSRRHLKAWLTPKDVFASMGVDGDTTSGRRRFTARMNALMRGILDTPEDQETDQSWARIRRGWYLGEESFKDQLLNRIAETLDGRKNESYHGGSVRAHHALQAQRDLDQALKVIGISLNDLIKRKQNDPYKQGVAWWIRGRSTVSNAWIADRLQMGDRRNIMRACAAYRCPEDREHRRIKVLLSSCPD